MTSYEVRLDIFEGPLDLLLYLIKRNNLSIRDIRISLITGQYLEYLELMREMNLDIAGEFLVMATTLMEIKAKSLLPKPDDTLDTEIEQIQRDLADRLAEYQKFKNAALSWFKPREQVETNVFYRRLPVFSDDDYYLEASIFDLLTSLNDVIRKVPREYKEIVVEEIHIEEKMRLIMEIVRDRPFVPFAELVAAENGRRGIIVMFLALLELIKTQQVFARQREPFGDIRIYPARFDTDPPAPQENPVAEPAAASVAGELDPSREHAAPPTNPEHLGHPEDVGVHAGSVPAATPASPPEPERVTAPDMATVGEPKAESSQEEGTEEYHGTPDA
jgi:segregation and condensation protein A